MVGNSNGVECIAAEGFAVGATCDLVPKLIISDGTEALTAPLTWEKVPRFWTVAFLQLFSYVWFSFLANVLLTVLSNLSNVLPAWAFAICFITSPVAVALLMFVQAVLLKHCFIGRFEEADIPLWSIAYFRWWLAQKLTSNVLFVPGTYIGVFTTRLLGASIGKDVYLGLTTFPVEYDLVTIEDGATLAIGSKLQTWLIENRVLKLRRVHVGKRCYVGEQSVVSMSGRMGEGVVLCPLSILPRREQIPSGSVWAGSPARVIPPEALPSRTENSLTSVISVHKQVQLRVGPARGLSTAIAVPKDWLFRSGCHS